MRGKFFLSLGLVLLLCLVGWTQYAKAQRSSSINHAWEYRVDPVPQIVGYHLDTDQASVNSRLINQRATEGWELAAVGTGFFYFKRPRQ